MVAKRSKPSKFFAWVIVAILVLGLAGFGIQDVIRSSGKSNIIEFANQTASGDDYVRMIRQEVEALSKKLGTPLSFDQANKLGVTQIALQKLLSTVILDQAAHDLRVSRGDEALKNSIQYNPAFSGPDGQFDQNTYKLSLQNINLQPKEYEELLRKEMSRFLVIDLLTTDVNIKENFSNLIFQYLNEQRTFDIVSLTENDLKIEIDITEAEIRKYYDSFQNEFTRPETKKLTYIYLPMQQAITKQQISEEEIKAEYEYQKDFLNIPERRKIKQVFFQKKSEAEDALTLNSSKINAFNQIVKNRRLRDEDIVIDSVSKDQLPKDAALEIFAEQKEGIFGPYETDAGFAIYNVIEIIPAIEKTLSTEYQIIKEQLAEYKADEYLNDLALSINDSISEGLSLEEIAQATEMSIKTLNFYDGAELPKEVNYNSFRAAINNSSEVETDIIFNDDGGIFSIRLNEVIQPSLISFEEAKLLVKERAIAEKTLKELKLLAEILINESNQTSRTIYETAQGKFGDIKLDQVITRLNSPKNISRNVKEITFSKLENEKFIVVDKNKVSAIHLKKVSSKTDSSEKLKNLKDSIRNQLSQSFRADILNTLINSFRQNHELNINQKAIDQTIARFQ